MKAAKHDSMVEALRRNRAHGLDITITLDAPDGAQVMALNENAAADGLLGESENAEAEQERRALDLAPNAEEIDADHPDEQEDVELIRSELDKVGLGRKKQTF